MKRQLDSDEKKALHVRSSIKALQNGKIVAAQLETSLGDVVSQALKLYYRLHLLARAEQRDTQDYIMELVKNLTQPYKEEKKDGEKTGKEY